MNNLTDLTEWQTLAEHQQNIAHHHMRDWFQQDPERFSRFSLSMDELFLDYSRNRITDDTLTLLCNLAHAVKLPEKIQALFSGTAINTTENRPALHTALRDKSSATIHVNNENILPLVRNTLDKLYQFTEKVHRQEWKGITGKPIAHIVNVGIGGSCLGPMLCTQALQEFAVSDLRFHFISSVDNHHVNDVLRQIDPETTLFIISSKSFTTLETATNARTLTHWMRDQLGQQAVAHHFVAVTQQPDKALALGITPEHIFPLWDWVGGRYSIWSAIGLPLLLMIGREHFEAFLAGAHAMDQHFLQTDFRHNMPVVMALLSVWYMNFFHAKVHAIVPYSHRLTHLIAYLQQAEMESNGKNVDLQGRPVAYATGPVIFGGEGCNGQHAYLQLLHQGQHLIPVDFILVGQPANQHLFTREVSLHHHDIVIASALSQAKALMCGKTFAEAEADLLARQFTPADAAKLAHHQAIPGNRPSNIVFMQHLSPKNLGALLALYEHKIFVQGAIWDINSFDQWGVELGKQLLPAILQHLQSTDETDGFDSATAKFIHHFKKSSQRP